MSGLLGVPLTPISLPSCQQWASPDMKQNHGRHIHGIKVKVRIDSFAGWEELIMNETVAAPPNTEHELLLEAGRFWSRYYLASRHPHLPSAPFFATSTRRSAVWGEEGHRGPK